jgi:glycosyltransferase involved in cell wall biosynthesis
MDFSVVIPLYNKTSHIHRTINSVLSQTHPNFEIIVVDDGSTDNGVEIVSSIQDERIRIIHQQNAGVSMARNRGIQEAKYDVIAFLDADDEWLPNFLEEIGELYREYPECGIYATFYKIILSNGTVECQALKGAHRRSRRGIIKDIFTTYHNYFPFTSSSVMVPKDVLEKVGGFPSGIKFGEDRITWIKIALSSPIAFSSSIQSIYHMDASNRACDTISLTKETALQKFLRLKLDDVTLSDKVKHGLKDYYVAELVNSAKFAIVNGYPDYARPFIRKAYGYRIYPLQLFFWTFCSLIPKHLFQKLFEARNFLRRENDHEASV